MKAEKWGFILIIFLIVQVGAVHGLSGQCTSGYTSGNLTINSVCTISANITITGNMILNNGANLTIAPGVIVTVNGYVSTGWNAGNISVSGGTINIGSYLLNSGQTTLNITGTTMSTTTYLQNDFKSNINISNSVINTGTYLYNEDQANMTISNTVSVIGGYMKNDFKANFQLLNGSDMTINGNPALGGYALHNDDQTDFIIDNSSIAINGNVWNDFKGNMEVNNGGSMVVDGNFLNDDQATLALSEGSLQVTGNFINDFKAEIDINDGSQMLIGGNLTNDPRASIDVAAGGGFCTAGTTSNADVIEADAGDTDCSDGCCGSVVTLPVELIYFTGSNESGQAILSWKTATEINNEYFTIEQSTDGIVFYEVGRVDGNGDSEKEITYSWSENLITGGMVYYRLRQTDYDGKFEYLGMISIQAEERTRLSLFPNPVFRGQEVVVSGQIAERLDYTIQDLFGKQVAQATFLTNNRIQTDDLKPGIYIISFYSGDRVFSEKLIIR